MKLFFLIASMSYAIFCDFDGTITLEDTGKKLLSSLTQEDWRYYDLLVIDGKMGTREALIKQYGLVKNVDIDDINQIVDTIKLDPTFKQFYSWILENDLPFQIVSDGFIQCIKKILTNNGFNVEKLEIKANSFEIINGRIKLSFLTNECEHGCANCKHSHVKKYKDKGYKIIYIGDGLSDILPATTLADYIFAKKGGDLAKKVEGMKNVYVFVDFNDIIKELKKIIKIK